MRTFRGALNALGISLILYALIAVWFNVTVFAVLLILSMLCLIRGEQLRRNQIRRDKTRHPSVEAKELARCMDCGGWWTLDSLALSGGACGHCTPVRAPGTGGDR